MLKKIPSLTKKSLQLTQTLLPKSPPGGICELIGLPGSGKHLIAPVVRRALFLRGWNTFPPNADFRVDNESRDHPNQELFYELLARQVHRLRDRGCALPFLSEYIRSTARILSWSWSARYMVRGSWFLDESLLHHFGPEIAEILSDDYKGSHEAKKALDREEGIFGGKRLVIMTTAPRSKILERLETRRGRPVHTDWATAYGNCLEEYLSFSEHRLDLLVESLKKRSIPVLHVETQKDLLDFSLVRQTVISFDKDLRKENKTNSG